MDEKAIKDLSEKGLGAREIAKKLGHKHQSSVFKVMKRLGCEKHTSHQVEKSTSKFTFTADKTQFRHAAEHFVKYFFASRGIPFFEGAPGSPFDLLVLIDGEYRKVQVKSSTAISTNGHASFTLMRTRNNTTGSKKKPYSEEECDFFFLLDVRLNAWLIPHELLVNQRSVVPELRYPGYKVVVAK